MDIFRWFAARRVVAARFVPAWLVARWQLCRWLAARRLDALKRAAQFGQLALIGKLLALGDLDEFQHLIQLINHLLERLGDLRGVRHRFADGGGFGRTKISRLDPLALARRLRSAFRARGAGKFATRFARWFGRTF